MEETKEKEIFMYVEVSIPMCSPSVGNAPRGYRPCATLPQENPLMWEPPPTTKVHELGRKSVQKL